MSASVLLPDRPGRLRALAGGAAALLPPELLIVVLPLLMLAFDSSWIFPRPDTVDPWMYVAYFVSPRHMLASFPGAYHGTRLPIILPGAASFKLFRPDVALVVLHLALWYLSVFSLYGTIRMLIDRRTAVLTALLCGCNAMFLSVIGLNHADCFGVSYGLLTIFLVALATQGRYWLPVLFAAGFTSALFLFTNLAYLPACAVFPWLLCTLPRDKSAKDLGFGLAAVAFGLVSAVAFMGVANKLLGGGFAFFMPWLRAMIGMIPHSGVCTSNDRSWVTHAVWLVFPFAVCAAGLWTWRAGKLDATGRAGVHRSLFGAFALVVVALIGFESLRLIHYLQFSFYASLLLPALFIGTGGLLGLAVPAWSPRTWAVAVGLAFVLGLCVVAPINGNYLRGLNTWALPAAMFAVGAVVLARPNLAREHAPALAIGFVAAGNVFVAASFDRFLDACPLERKHVNALEWVGRWQDPVVTRHDAAQKPTRRQVFRFCCGAFKEIVAQDVTRTYTFWFDVSEPHGPVYTALSSMYLWDQRFLSIYFPKLEDLVHKPAFDKAWTQGIVILSERDRDVVAESRKALLQFGSEPVELGTLAVPELPALPIKVTVVKPQEARSVRDARLKQAGGPG